VDSVEKPLHVRVAEALGWTEVEFRDGCWWGLKPGAVKVGPYRDFVPHFDRETQHQGYEDYIDGWAATGPLIERLQPDLYPLGKGWEAVHDSLPAPIRGVTLLQTVCLLILALHEAGKLPK
jgi:hypothetical protein